MAAEVYRGIVEGEEYVTDLPVCRGLQAAAVRLRDESRNEMIELAAHRETAEVRDGAKKALVADSSEDKGDCGDRIEQFWNPYVHFGD